MLNVCSFENIKISLQSLVWFFYLIKLNIWVPGSYLFRIVFILVGAFKDPSEV